jgi:heat shock protein HslJ
MKTITSTVVWVLNVLLLISCGNTSSKKEYSGNLINWEGIYSNVVPCADCEGIQTTVVLNKDMTYSLITKYLSKDTNVYSQKGNFLWNKQGNRITLKNIDPNAFPTKYIIEENKLIQLDILGNPLEETMQLYYTLEKVSDIVEKPWKLIELNGKEIKPTSLSKEACFILKVENNRVNGNGSCNSFSGTYTLHNGKKIKFSQFTSTKKACKNMKIETEFFMTLALTDHYEVIQDTLFLTTKTKSFVAKFMLIEKPEQTR